MCLDLSFPTLNLEVSPTLSVLSSMRPLCSVCTPTKTPQKCLVITGEFQRRRLSLKYVLAVPYVEFSAVDGAVGQTASFRGGKSSPLLY